MGFIETEERRNMEVEEFKRTILACASLGRRKDDEEFKGLRAPSKEMDDDGGEKLVCVTSGLSFLGVAVVNRLLARGYSVRIMVDNEDDIEKLRELETSGVIRTGNNSVTAMMAAFTSVESLWEAFQGCRGVFHTSSFADPAGLSGYTKSMAGIEAKACENVIKACSRTGSVRHIVLTSTLLACIWRDVSSNDLSTVINHQSWSDETICIEKKLWYALGKLRAEKAAWTMAAEEGLKLVTVCAGLITGPDFFHRNPTATIAYLKGAQEMYKNGLLATVDVMKLAEAHACVYEAMNKSAFGRYICYDHIIERADQAEKLAMQIDLPVEKICGNASHNNPTRFQLSNKKLCNLMSRTLRSSSCHDHS